MPEKKILRAIKPTPLRGTLKTKDIERAVDAVVARRLRPGSQPKAAVQVSRKEVRMADAALASDRWVTADQLLEMPDDGLRRELIRGEVRVMSPAGRSHGKVALRLGRRLGEYVDEHGLGEAYGAETGFRVSSDPDTVLAPDASFVRRERLEELSEEGLIVGPPDLAVEVISPRDSFSIVEEKVFDWLAAGCRMVIVVNPRRRAATIYRSPSDIRLLTENDAIDGGDVVPGWTLPLRGLFG